MSAISSSEPVPGSGSQQPTMAAKGGAISIAAELS